MVEALGRVNPWKIIDNVTVGHEKYGVDAFLTRKSCENLNNTHLHIVRNSKNLGVGNPKIMILDILSDGPKK